MKYNRLTVVEGSEFKDGPRNHKKVTCICDCGNTCIKWLSDIKMNKTTSCGCFRKETTRNTGKLRTTHGHSGAKSRTYSTWFSMRMRCGEEGTYKLVNYDPRWDSFELFLSDMGERPKDMSLDRIDNNKGYSKENCRWATAKNQTLNRKTTRWFTFNDETLCLKDWSRRLGVGITYLHTRLVKRQMPLSQVIYEIENP
jgi:hypothetical protein